MPDIRAALQTGLAGSHTIDRELGRGGMARVFLARDLKHDRLVALKVLDPELAKAIGSERFLREIKVAARLQHPHILTVHDSGEIPGNGRDPALLWFSMPYVEGETLQERLKREGQLPLADAATIARETADALAYAHEHGVIHRDIKPGNLLLTGGHTMVADFGVARALGDEVEHLTGTGLSIGTPEYMSPEQATAGHVDGRSDIYALGCVLYEMIAGQPPYAGPTPVQVLARAMTEPYRPLRSVRETVPPALDQVAAIALARAPADRYSTAAEMAHALRPEVITPTEVPTPRPPRHRRKPVVLAGIGVLLLLLVAAFALIFRRSTRAGGADPNLIAVAPFDLVSATPGLGVWSEGIVDVVARYFDGAGTLRAVAPTRAIRAWTGRADRESATRFGQRLAAGYVVYGQLVGSDSVRLTATLYDVAASVPVDEHEWRGTSREMDRLADSLSTRFLDVLGRTRQIGARRTDPIGTSNPLAIREFLSGMRDFRRAAYGEAAQHFAESVRQDTGFVLGRMYGTQAYGWLHSAGDSTAIRLALEAGNRNHGLTRRDSLLVVADSVDAAIYQQRKRGPPFLLLGRLSVIMDSLLRSNPDDPEVVYWVTDENHHMNPLGRRERWHLDGFKHAIALDPLFAPAYEHGIELSAMLDPPEVTRALIRGMLTIPGIDSVRAGALRLTDRLLDSAVSPSAKQGALDSASEPILQRAGFFVYYSSDTLGIMAARTVVKRFPRVPQAPDNLIWQLLYHGRLKEAAELLPNSTNPRFQILFARELTSLGILPLATFDSLYDAHANELSSSSFSRFAGVALWVAARDTGRLNRFYDQYELLLQGVPPPQRKELTTALEFIRAMEQLARGDSSWFKESGLRKRQVPTGMRAESPLGLFPVEMALALHDEEDAWTLLQSRGAWGPSSVIWRVYRARMAEERGERGMALDDYGFVARLWANADEPVRAFALEAKEGLARLSSEP
jgi:serine/threonine-protein kinase